jgi:hypothetical protein
LGEPFGTATNKLRKSILFKLVKELNLDICFRCEKRIEDINNFSIEHKIAWQSSKNPVEMFYDLDNIAFSHLDCNCKARNTRAPRPGNAGEKSSSAKLTRIQVEEIRKKLNQGYSLITLSKEYSVDERNIAQIRDRKTWKEVKNKE